ncbi:hypothetical protein AAMO2058_001338100 [Amorphochlora amoebiformis]
MATIWAIVAFSSAMAAGADQKILKPAATASSYPVSHDPMTWDERTAWSVPNIQSDEPQNGFSFIETHAQASLDTDPPSPPALSALDSCRTCVFILERFKRSTNTLLPAMCSEVYDKFPGSYGMCHQVLASLRSTGGNIRNWLYEGCYKYEVYQAKEWVRPCPSHVMCAALQGLDKSNFCQQMPMEDPFSDPSASEGAESEGTSSGGKTSGGKTSGGKTG